MGAKREIYKINKNNSYMIWKNNVFFSIKDSLSVFKCVLGEILCANYLTGTGKYQTDSFTLNVLCSITNQKNDVIVAIFINVFDTIMMTLFMKRH